MCLNSGFADDNAGQQPSNRTDTSAPTLENQTFEAIGKMMENPRGAHLEDVLPKR